MPPGGGIEGKTDYARSKLIPRSPPARRTVGAQSACL